MDIESNLGQEKMSQLVEIIKNFSEMTSEEVESELDDIFGSSAQLLARFIDFLPGVEIDKQDRAEEDLQCEVEPKLEKENLPELSS